MLLFRFPAVAIFDGLPTACSKFLLCLVLVGMTGITYAQPGGGVREVSLEAKVIQRPIVFVGTITNVVETIVHTNTQFHPDHLAHPEFPIYSYDIASYVVTLRVDEVLKGGIPRKLIVFEINGTVPWKYLKGFAADQVSFLWFLQSPAVAIGEDHDDMEEAVLLDSTIPGRTIDRKAFNLKYDRVFGMDLTLLDQPEDIMARARKFAKKRSTGAEFVQLHLPFGKTFNWYSYYNTPYLLQVPVDPILEKIAKRLIDRPGDIITIPDGESTLDPNLLCVRRADGVSALAHFKSRANIKLLKSLLRDPDCWQVKYESAEYRGLNVSDKYYSVRESAYGVLTAWGVDVPKPVIRETAMPNRKN